MNLNRLAEGVTLGTPGRPAPWAVWLVRTVFRPIARIAFRPTLEGVEHLPSTGPFLLVANHSGAMGVAEILCFAALYVEQVGTERRLAGFAHPFAFDIWPLRVLMRGLGAVPSTHAAGEAALASGAALLVFPGGDYEAGRPLWRANSVDFGGRRGFLKLARRARVPIVPLGFRGSHWTAPVLWQSRVLSYLFVLPWVYRVKRYPLTLLALLGAAAIVWGFPSSVWGGWRFVFAWLWLSSPFALLPWVPSTVRARIGPPIAHTSLFEDGGEGGRDEASLLARALDRVQQAVQSQVNE